MKNCISQPLAQVAEGSICFTPDVIITSVDVVNNKNRGKKHAENGEADWMIGVFLSLLENNCLFCVFVSMYGFHG